LPLKNHRAAFIIFAAAIVAAGVFAYLAARSITIVQTDRTGAQNNFDDALAGVRSPLPLVRRDPAGRFVRRPRSTSTSAKPTHLHVLAYYADGNRLVRADLPLWLYKVKGPAAAYALRGTGFDLDALGLTASELQQEGAGVVLDEARANGDRLLAWTS